MLMSIYAKFSYSYIIYSTNCPIVNMTHTVNFELGIYNWDISDYFKGTSYFCTPFYKVCLTFCSVVQSRFAPSLVQSVNSD